MTPIDLLTALQRAGLKTELRDGLLMVGPRERITDDLRELLTEYGPDLTGYLATGGDEALSWRIGAMLRQLREVESGQPLPLLCARPEAEAGRGLCYSCGERTRGLACDLCARAKAIALELWMQRPGAALVA